MTDFLQILNDATNNKISKPASKEIVSALLSAEKYSHQHKPKYNIEQLNGNWQLHFITGTKNSQKKLGNILGSGFYLPFLTQVIISYNFPQNSDQGRVENTVKFGLVKFSIDGPCKFIDKKNIIAFDFTYLTMEILGNKVYQTNIRNGRKGEANFYQTNISKQAFFSYFLVTDKFITARGRGGGLALWKKQ